MTCPHFKIRISSRGKKQSAVAQAAYQSGEKLFDERSRRTKNYSEKRGIIYIRKQLLKKESNSETRIKPVPKNHKMRSYPITKMMKAFFQRLRTRNVIHYPDNNYLFPDPDQPNGIIRLRATYELFQDICTELSIPIDASAIKGPHAFRRTHESSFLDAGGSREIAGRVYGNTPKTIMQHYELASNAKIAAPYIESVQENIFGDLEKVNKVNENEETPETA